MTFSFELDMDELFGEYGGDERDFKATVMNEAIKRISSHVFNGVTSFDYVRSTASEAVKNMIRSRSDEIITAVVERVADKVAKKKAIVALSPKAADVARIDRENEEYFLRMIDVAIAKRFS